MHPDPLEQKLELCTRRDLLVEIVVFGSGAVGFTNLWGCLVLVQQVVVVCMAFCFQDFNTRLIGWFDF